MRVLRVYHGGRDPQHRGRDRALVAAGVDVTLVLPSAWPDEGAESQLSTEPFAVMALPVRRAGDVNRHSPLDVGAVERILTDSRPDVLDIHEEPFSDAARLWLRAARGRMPVVMYTAQNIDKRFPPPFGAYEHAAHRRVAAFYPCTNQAASVLRGKGFTGTINVLPLGYDDSMLVPGSQSLNVDDIILMLVGRLVREKGVEDAIRTLAHVHAMRPTRLVVSGRGPEEVRARALAASLGVDDRVDFLGWRSTPQLAADYRAAHVVLVPSRPTETWVEQFGRVIVEAQASGSIVAGYANGAISEVAGAAGIVVPTGDVELLAESVVRVVSNADEFASRRDAGIRQAVPRTWHAVASGHLALYNAVTVGEHAQVALRRTPRQRRAAAHGEFGPTASTLAGPRPFALPLLRRGGFFATTLAAAIDAAAELDLRFRR